MNKTPCAFTGHRPSRFSWGYNEADKDCIALKEILTSEIIRLIDMGVTQFLSGMAEGVDCWAATIVLALREKNFALKLHCILPCKTQADSWSPASKGLYHSILEQADSIVYVSRDYHKKCMMERNRFLVNHSDILLAICREIPRSGTKATIYYARKMNKEVIMIDPFARRLIHENPTTESYPNR